MAGHQYIAAAARPSAVGGTTGFAKLMCDHLGERLDGSASALREAFEFVGLKEPVRANSSELDDHTAASRVVECMRELVVPGLQEAEHIQVPVVVTPRTVSEDGLDFLARALAE